MERRKVQKTGGSTYIVSIPKDWAEGRIEEGEEVFLSEEGKSLRIFLEEVGEEKKEITLEYEEPLGALLRKIIAYYVMGYDEITVESSEVIKRKDEVEKLVREKIMGLEVTRESSKEIKLQNLLKFSDLPTKQLLRRIDSILKTMYEDVLSSFQDDGGDVLRDVIERENEIDRLYLLGMRQVKGAIDDERTRKKLEIESKALCLGYRIILKSLERIGDHLRKISSLILNSEEGLPERGRLVEVAERTFEIYKTIIESLFKRDGELAEDSIQKSKKIDEMFIELNEMLGEGGGYFVLKTVMNSIDRTRKLSRDIAEIVINLSASGV